MEQLNRLAFFARVYDEGSFSALARRIGVKPSSVSRQISALEDDLGARLFNRTTRSLGLTEAGEVLLEYANRIVAEAAQAKEAVALLGAEPSGALRVTASTELAQGYIVPHVPAFLARYPKIRLSLSLGDRVANLTESGFDLAIRLGHLVDTSLVARRIATSYSMLCGSPEYFVRAGVPVHPEQLAEHDCLSFRTSSGSGKWRFDTPQGPISVRIQGRFSVNSGEALVSAALAGLGIVMLPHWLVGDAVQTGRLQTILEDFAQVPSSTPIHAVFPHRRHVAPKVRAFIDFFAEQFGAQPLSASEAAPA